MENRGGPFLQGPAGAWAGAVPAQLGAQGSFTTAADVLQQQQHQQMQAMMQPLLWQQNESFQQLLSEMSQQQHRLQSDFTQALHDSLRARDAREVRQRTDNVPQDDNPDKVFNTLDPRVQNIMRQISKDWDRRIERLFHQRNLKSKYDSIDAAGSVHHDFAVEGDREWQFAKEYKAVATPSELERSSAEQGDAPMRAYDLEHAWRSMRQRHAKECWMFVKQHQSQFLQHLEHTTTQQYFKQEAIAKIAEYTEQLKGYYSSDVVKRLTDKALVWTELKTRSSMGFWSEKTASMKAKQQKRQQELDKAQASYESMDARALFAALTLEAQGVKKQQDGSDKHKRGKPITVHKNSALGSILNQFEPIAKMYNIQIKAYEFLTAKEFVKQWPEHRLYSTNMLQLAKSRLSQMTSQALAAQAISRQQARFLLDNLNYNSAPRFRVNVKIHKNPIDSRPICNNAKFCLCNAGIFLGVYMQPIVHKCKHVIPASAHVVNWADNYKPARDDMFVSFDIKALYPSLQIWPVEHSQESLDVYTVVSASIWRHYQRNPCLAFLLDALLHCIL
ncbi:hypothetical protein AK812_SmicGene33790 [Symbiodinium microadriaticum]|uniref:Uncharacterized protein n=1 Tax=Symbiodinium microadriaticum TaxID=2951 RepID=A0A1Q9CQP5_SYMMI|nr:hypothetical protein AK812_SmicGene33790 [Symbiodinium microadriaticum]